MPSRTRGPRLGTKLALLGSAVLALPYFFYLQLVEMERLLVQGQSHTQLLTAEGISTLFNGREDLFRDLPVNPKDYDSLHVHPIENPIRLDGDVSDWGEVETRVQRFGTGEAGAQQDGSFDLVLGDQGGDLYVHMRIRDDAKVYRDFRYLRLDNADHVRLSFIRPDGEDGRIAVTLPAPATTQGDATVQPAPAPSGKALGVTTAYWMQEDWRFAETGAPETQIKGSFTAAADGIGVELRMPLALLGSNRYFGLSFVDVDDPASRAVRDISQTLPVAGKESFNLVIYRSPELVNIIEGLGYSGARIQVIDAQQRVRADTGSYRAAPPPDLPLSLALGALHWFRGLGSLFTDTAEEAPGATAAQVIDAALGGDPITGRRTVDGHVEVIMAAHPIISKDATLGAVVVEQNIEEILAFQREAFEQVVLVSLVSLLVVFLALLAFAGRLAWRIRHLRREAAAAIDEHGRLTKQSLDAERSAGDEIGDLSRSVSNMLGRLHQHTHFLEKMPRTLRHEINNPLNALATSIENLKNHVHDDGDKYLASAKRGVLRIGAIVQNLADAVSLEESLAADDREVIDVGRLIENYVANFRATLKGRELVFRGVNEPVYAAVADYRIEQMLDKIIDNAVDFHHVASPIKVQLDVARGALRITVANRGPTLPKTEQNQLFESMVSHRGPQSGMHFGLGLYVVRTIAEHHGGSARAINLIDGSGVAIMVQLPLASSKPATEARSTEAQGTQDAPAPRTLVQPADHATAPLAQAN